MKRQVYLLPNVITAFGLACGLFVIFKVNMLEPGMGVYQVLFTSTLLLLLAAFADVVDGAVARMMRAESEFGLIFDSLTDAISFGVAPAVLFLKSLSLEQGTGLSFFAVSGAMIYAICCVLRLVRYSVRATFLKKGEEKGHKKRFIGLPSTAAGVAAASVNLFLNSPLSKEWFSIGDQLQAILLTSSMIALGFLMVSRWKFPSLAAFHFRVPSFQLVLTTVIFTIFILYGTLHFFSAVLVGVTWGYIGISCLRSLFAGKRAKPGE